MMRPPLGYVHTTARAATAAHRNSARDGMANDLPEDVVARVTELIHRSTQTPIRKIRLDADLGRDLRIDGDDASELLRLFSKEFKVDLNGFNFDDYFGPEAGFDPVVWLVKKATGKLPSYKPLTVRDLVVA